MSTTARPPYGTCPICLKVVRTTKTQEWTRSHTRELTRSHGWVVVTIECRGGIPDEVKAARHVNGGAA